MFKYPYLSLFQFFSAVVYFAISVEKVVVENNENTSVI